MFFLLLFLFLFMSIWCYLLFSCFSRLHSSSYLSLAAFFISSSISFPFYEYMVFSTHSSMVKVAECVLSGSRSWNVCVHDRRWAMGGVVVIVLVAARTTKVTANRNFVFV